MNEENKDMNQENTTPEVKEKESFLHRAANWQDEHKAKKAAKAEARAAKKAAGDTKGKKALKVAGGIVGGLAAVGGVALAVLTRKENDCDESDPDDYFEEGEPDRDPDIGDEPTE